MAIYATLISILQHFKKHVCVYAHGNKIEEKEYSKLKIILETCLMSPDVTCYFATCCCDVNRQVMMRLYSAVVCTPISPHIHM